MPRPKLTFDRYYGVDMRNQAAGYRS